MAEDTRSGAEAPLVSGADIRTFLFADMRGYTRYTQEHGDDAASALAGRFADLVKETVPAFEGELLELRGVSEVVVAGVLVIGRCWVAGTEPVEGGAAEVACHSQQTNPWCHGAAGVIRLPSMS